MSDLYLQHHGVLGMKWGVRRYQNKDGSLTSAGKRRFHKLISLREEEEKAKQISKKSENEEYKYLKKSGYLKRGEEYKEAAKKLYDDDSKFKDISDRNYANRQNLIKACNKATKELSKVSRSRYGVLTQIGYDRTKQILKAHDDYMSSLTDELIRDFGDKKFRV